MARWLLCGFATAAGLVLAAAAERTAPPLPKDTLPAKLVLDHVPDGLDPKRPVPDDSPLTEARAELGRRLFFDPILSADGTVACASCHDPAHGFAGTQPRAVGIAGKVGRRNAPSLFNRAYGSSFFWDGRAKSLEEQALKPIADPSELGSSVEDAVKRIGANADYQARFAAAFPD